MTLTTTRPAPTRSRDAVRAKADTREALTAPGGEVTQADRDFAAGWIVINLEDAKLIRAGLWDGHAAVIATMDHRLSGRVR